MPDIVVNSTSYGMNGLATMSTGGFAFSGGLGYLTQPVWDFVYAYATNAKGKEKKPVRVIS